MVLGIVQGVTEFAPISSSGHLVIVPWVLGWNPPGLAFDTVLHLGTLVAVLGVFWGDVIELSKIWLRSFSRGGGADPRATTAWAILVGTLPAALAGYFLEGLFERLFLAPLVVGVFLLVTALALVSGEFLSRRRPIRLGAPDLTGGLLVGLAQAFAVAPGISRSGATISMGIALGLSREDSARFSFLLSIPIILGASISQIRDIAQAGGLDTQGTPLIVGFLAATISGYLCINFFLSFLRRRSLFAFSAYCFLFGLGTIAVWLVRG